VLISACMCYCYATVAQLHLQMIYFGREYCTAKNHEVGSQPLLHGCMLYLLHCLLRTPLFLPIV
jgi:hypothetical protein